VVSSTRVRPLRRERSSWTTFGRVEGWGSRSWTVSRGGRRSGSTKWTSDVVGSRSAVGELEHGRGGSEVGREAVGARGVWVAGGGESGLVAIGVAGATVGKWFVSGPSLSATTPLGGATS
jgi:hypothetical protein